MRRFLIIFYFFLMASQYTYADDISSAPYLRDVSTWPSSLLNLEKKRLNIQQNFHQNYLSKWNPFNSSQNNSRRWANNFLEGDLEIHRAEILFLKNVTQDETRQSQFIKLKTTNPRKELLKLNKCLEILEVLDPDLKKKMVLAVDKNTQNSSQEASLNLAYISWHCRRKVGKWTGKVSIDHASLAACFYTVLKEEADKENIKLLTETTKPLSGYSDQKLDFKDTKINPIDFNLTERIESLDNYFSSPWEVFRLCAKEARGDVTYAFDICYRALRLNRSRLIVGRKLLDIRGDRQLNGDNAGDWYHLFGTMRMGFLADSDMFFNIKVQAESFTSWIMFEYDEAESKVNEVGMFSGFEIKKLILENASFEENTCEYKKVFSIK